MRVTLEPSGQEVAVIAPRRILRRDVDAHRRSANRHRDRRSTTRTLLEITAERFRELAVLRAGLVEQVSEVVSARRVGLESARAAADEARASLPARGGLLERIKKYLSL